MYNIKQLTAINWKNVSIKKVLEGCAEHFFSDFLDRGEKHAEVVKYRLGLCRTCPLYNVGVCDPTKEAPNVTTGVMTKGCGCSIHCKSALHYESCPRNLWLAVQ